VVADERILSTQLYVRGRFSRDSIREALSLIAAVYPSQVGEWRRDDRIAALQQLFEGDLEDVADSALPCGYSGRELLEGVEGTIGEFAERFPLVAKFMSKNGLDPDMRAKLDVSIVVSLGGHGSSISRHGRAFRDGIEVPAYEANRVSFAIRR
jgi:hypothetical protein